MKLRYGFIGLCIGMFLWCVSEVPAEVKTKSDPSVKLPKIQPYRSLPGQFVQDRFAIGFWVDPPVDGKADRRYKEIADANFTVVIGGYGANSQKTVAQQLQMCEKYGLKAIVWSGDPSLMTPDASKFVKVEDLPESPACWGYFVKDEPGQKLYSFFKKRVDEIRLKRPGKLAMINLFPIYANTEQMQVATYEEYVARFISEVNPDVLCMDHYPGFYPAEDGRDLYCETLKYMRTYSLAANIPFWNFFNCFPFDSNTDPTEDQLRWQVYASIAYGAKGLFYFCYYTPWYGASKGGCIIDRLDRKTRHYDQAKRINYDLINLGSTLMKLTSVGVYRVKPGDDPAKVLAGTPIKSLTLSQKTDPAHDYLIGFYRHADKRKAVLLQNYRYAFTAWPTVEFNVPIDQVREVDKKTGQERPVMDDSPDLPGLQISLDAGEGRLFLFP